MLCLKVKVCSSYRTIGKLRLPVNNLKDPAQEKSLKTRPEYLLVTLSGNRKFLQHFYNFLVTAKLFIVSSKRLKKNVAHKNITILMYNAVQTHFFLQKKKKKNLNG